MAIDGKSDADIIRILEGTRTIALVGASQNPARAAYGVLGHLIGRGYDVYPVNPGLAGQQLQGRTVFASLADVPVAIDMVDVFRNSNAAGETIDEALALPTLPKTIWLQLGVIHDEGFAKAEAKGVAVVMDRCPAIEGPRLGV